MHADTIESSVTPTKLTLKRRPHICKPASVPGSLHITSGGSQWGLLHYRGAGPYLLTTIDTYVTNTNCICPRYTGEATRTLSGPS